MLIVLKYDNSRKFVNSVVINETKEFWLEYIIVSGLSRHPQSQGRIQLSNYDVENML
jgi:hypothetical protein